ncbi:MAG: RluA family pseudouridine synthase [Planctomycetes bacterium]|nr:RluA family pseudouridine synthase [Planctomycetota bacterium]
MPATRTVTITENEANQRLDRFLRKLLDDVSLSAIYRLVRTRAITVNGGKSRPEHRLNIGDVVSFAQAAEERHLQPKLRKRADVGFSRRRDFKVVFEDDAIVAVNKPAGVLVHAGDRGEGRDTLIDQVTSYLLEKPIGGEATNLKDFVRPSPTFSPGLAHRLDRETSGLVLIGKTLPAIQKLTDAIKHRRIEKLYVALIFGGLDRREGTIDVPIARQEDSQGRRRKVEAGEGRRAVTRYRVLAQRGPYSLVELELVTGRTHQLRAHLAHVGSPIVGDDEYGSREKNRHAREKLRLKRQFLHAARVTMEHPLTGGPLEIVAPLWPELSQALSLAGFSTDDLPSYLRGKHET